MEMEMEMGVAEHPLQVHCNRDSHLSFSSVKKKKKKKKKKWMTLTTMRMRMDYALMPPCLPLQAT